MSTAERCPLRPRGHVLFVASVARILRVAVVAIGVALLALVTLVASALAHAETEIGLLAAEHFVEWSGSRTSRGTVLVGRVRSLPPGRLSLLDYRIVAPNGEVVIRADEVAGMPEWRGLLDGQVRFRPSWFVRARIRLTPGPGGQINLVHASEVPEGVFTVPLVFEDIRLIDNEIFVDLPGKPPVTMRRVHGLADLYVGHFWQWRMDRNRGEVDASIPLVEPGFRQMSGRLRSDDPHPLVVRMIVNAGPIETALSLDYHVPALAGEKGEPYFELDLGEDGETEEQEEAREGLAEAREEREEVERALRERRGSGDEEEVRELSRARTALRREERRAHRRAEEAGAAGRDEREAEPARRPPATASEAEEREVRELARERPPREEIEEREREASAELRRQRREEGS